MRPQTKNDLEAGSDGERPILIHVGFQKCGSTWLQRHFFPNAAAGFRLLDPRGSLTHDLILPHPLVFNSRSCRQAFEPDLSSAWAAGFVPVLSGERLTGAGQTGGYDINDLAYRLRATFPEAKILMVIREQRAMILSSYNQALKGPLTVPIKWFIDPPTPPETGPYFSLDWLRYDRVISLYYELFGKDKVLVLPFEWLRNEPEFFVRKIADFAGCRVPTSLPYSMRDKKSWNPATLAVKRFINPFMHRSVNNGYLYLRIKVGWIVLKWLFTKVIEPATPQAWGRWVHSRWSAYVHRRVEGYYANSNSTTEQLTGLDLGALGYEVARRSPAEIQYEEAQAVVHT